MRRLLVFGIILGCSGLIFAGGNRGDGMQRSAAARSGFALPWKGEPITIRALGWVSYAQLDQSTKFAQWFQQKLGNITLEVEIPASEDATKQKIQMYLASGDMPDLHMIRDPNEFMAGYGDGSRTVNLLNYAQYMPEYTKRRESYPHLSKFDRDGASYLYFPALIDRLSELWEMNKTIMDKYGLSTPKNYVEMKAAMDKVLAGEPNMIGMLFLPWGFGKLYGDFATLLGGANIGPADIYWDFEKGRWAFALTERSDIYRRVTAELAEGYTKRYIHPDLGALGGEVHDNIRAQGRAVFYYQYIDDFARPEYVNNVLTYKAEFIESPAAVGVKPHVNAEFRSDPGGWGYVVAKNSKYPEIACGILELIGSNDLAQTYYWGWEGDTYETVNGSRRYKDSFSTLSLNDSKRIYGMQKDSPYWFAPYVSTCYVPDATIALWTPEAKAAEAFFAGKLKSGEYEYSYGRPAPDIDMDTAQENATIKTAVDTYIWENLTAFVMGRKPMSEWDSFVAGVSAYGNINKVVADYNAAPQKPFPANQLQRPYIVP
jgi:putative aldouronate transport system substrate-binding protein